MIIIWFFNYIKYRLRYHSGKNYLHKRIPPMTLKEYIVISRYFHMDTKATVEAFKRYEKATDISDIYPKTIFGRSTECYHGGYTAVGKEKKK